MYEKKTPLIYSIASIIFVILLGLLLRYSVLQLDYEWDFSFLGEYFWVSETGTPGLILKGLWGTIYISVVSIILGTIFGLLVGLALLSKEKILRAVAVVFVDIFRNTPVLVQLYVAYFIVGTALDLSPEAAGIMTLSLFCSSYIAEIFRGTIEEFEKGQIDAAKSMGLTGFQVARYVVAPQAIRRMLPPTIGQFVSLVKDSSLVSVVSVNELTKSAMNVVAVSFRSFETWFVIAIIYFVLNLVLSSLGRYIEKRMRIGVT